VRAGYEGLEAEVRGLRADVAVASRAAAVAREHGARGASPRAGWGEAAAAASGGGGACDAALECAAGLLCDGPPPAGVGEEAWEVLAAFLQAVAAGAGARRAEAPQSASRVLAVLADVAYADAPDEAALAELGCLLARAPRAVRRALPLGDVVRAASAQLGLLFQRPGAPER
jgi:hypothetical protein